MDTYIYSYDKAVNDDDKIYLSPVNATIVRMEAYIIASVITILASQATCDDEDGDDGYDDQSRMVMMMVVIIVVMKMVMTDMMT